MSPLRKLILALATLCALVALVGGWRVYRLYNPTLEDELPEFVELPEGPRAPKVEGLGGRIGVSTLPEVKAMLAAKGLECKDTSARMLIASQREAKKRELEEVKAAGGDVDAISGASMINHRSPKEKNPQVRLTCPDVDASLMGDRERPPAKGRWLFVFDSPTHPLRSVSFRRSHRSQSRALRDFDSAEAAMTGLFGEPTTSDNQPARALAGQPRPKGEDIFPRFRTINRQWDFADVQVKVTALNYGARGVDVLEAIEVPWPVRADAPSLP